MGNSAVAILIVILTFLVTYQGERDPDYKDRWLLWTDGVLIHREFDRLLSSGFLHSGWLHFGFNMVALFAFSYSLEMIMGIWNFLIIYFGALIGGNLLALYFHRNHGDYRALGASGAVSGVIMAAIVMFPNAEIGLILLPYGIKGWIFGAVFILISIFGVKSGAGNIGHDAHLGGAITGALIACLLRPGIALENWWVVLLILLPCSIFLYLVFKNPAILFVDNYWGEEVHRIKTRKSGHKQQPTLDDLLDKISREGIDALTKKERRILDEYQRGI